MTWLAAQTSITGSAEIQDIAIGDNIRRVYYDGAGNIKTALSTDQGATFGAAQTIDSTAGDNDVMLNDPLAYDPVTGRLHILYGRNTTNGSNPAVLCYRYTDNPLSATPTWSSEFVVDNGAAYGNNRFYRVAMNARNSIVSIIYETISFSTFTSDGNLWQRLSTDSGVTFAAKAQLFSGTVVAPTEPNCTGFTDGSLFVSWYDPGVQANQAGDLYVAVSRDNGQTWTASSPKKLTSTTDYGRPRISCDNGLVIIVANKPWDLSPLKADVYTVRSTDNGVTWGTPTLQASHTTGDLDHPDIKIVNKQVFLTWTDFATSPIGHGFIASSDGGVTYGSVVNPFGSSYTGTSDAPKLHYTSSYVILQGYDNVAGQTIWARDPEYLAIQPTVNTPVLDSFTRANEDPLSNGGKWTQGDAQIGATGNSCKVVSNAAVRHLAAGSFDRSANFWNQFTVSGSAEVYATINAIGGELDVEIGTTTKTGYYVAGQDGSFGTTFALNRQDTSSGTTLASSSSDANQAGDIVCLHLINSQVAVWRIRGGVVVEKFRVVDNTYRSGLRLMMGIAGLSSVLQAKNFGGGALTVPVNSVTPNATVSSGVFSCDSGTWTMSPVRFTYQWQNSTDGGTTWSSISGATLPFYTPGAGVTGLFRCQVTAINAIGSSTAANSNTVLAQQLARGISDVNTGAWSPVPTSPATLYDKINEAIANDTNYDESTTDPSSDIYEVRLGPLNNPGISVASGGVYQVSYRIGKDNPSGLSRIDLQVDLIDGATNTSIATWTHANVGALSTVQQALTQSQVNAITDWTNLHLRFTAIRVGP